MENLFQNLLSASYHGSVIILAVLVLRLALRKAPKKFICYLWMLAGLRLLLPVPLESRFSIQPPTIPVPIPANLTAVLIVAWGVVALGAASYSVISYCHLRRKVSDAVKVRGGWESDKIETAFVLGFLKPKIYIPVGISPADRSQILAHERTHLDKGDHWIKVIGFLALVLHWFNPLVWLSYILLCRDIEMACDERVVQFMELDERKAYASALLNCSTNHVHYAACPVAFGEVSVKYRIRSALKYKKPGFWLSLLAVLAVVFVIVCLFTSPAQTVEVVVDGQQKLQQSSRQDPLAYVQPTMPPCEPNPDCGLDVYMDVTSPSGGMVVYEIEERYAALSGELNFGAATMERWNGTAWEPMGTIPGLEGKVGLASSRDYAVEYWNNTADWKLLFGDLPAGDYRIVQTIDTLVRMDTFYAPFHIYREALPSEEEAALTRCMTALDQLKTSQSYSALISEQNDRGELSPVRKLSEAYNQFSAEHYLGEYTTWSGTGENAQYEIEDWEKPFRLEQNRKFLFPEGKSVISQEKIAFCSVWSDYKGVAHRGVDTFCFAENGNIASIQRQEETLNAQGQTMDTSVIRVDVQMLGFGALLAASTYEPADSFTAQENSPWGVFFRVDDDYLKPSGGEIWLGTNAVGVVKDYADGTYWLEKRVGTGWTRLGGEEKTASWGDESIPLRSQTWVKTIDWTADYGNLGAGVYRMGKRFYRDAESIIQYAEFKILQSGGVFGAGGEEALARVDAAIAKLQTQPYRVEKWEAHTNGYDSAPYLDSVYWHEGDTQVWDVCNQNAYSHSVVDQEGGFFYGDWLKRSYDNEAYDCMFFPDGYSVISDREIRFAHCYSTTGWADTCTIYTYLFDENGNLAEIRADYSTGYIRYVLTPTPESEIHDWVTQKWAEQNA